MKISKLLLAASIGTLAVVSTAPAQAQNYGGARKQKVVVKPATVTLPSGRQVTLSAKAGTAIVDLQAAVQSKDAAAIAAKLAVAQAEAKTADEKYLVGVMQSQAGLDANNMAMAEAGLTAMQATGTATPAELASRWAEIAKRHWTAKAMDPAGAAAERALAADPNFPLALKVLGLVRESQGRKADAVAAFLKANAAAKASGQRPSENDYKYALGLAYGARLPISYAASRDLVVAYPTAKNWHDALRVYREIANPAGDRLLDNMRLAALANGIETEAEYHAYLTELTKRGLNAEAKAILDAGAASKALDLTKPAFKVFVPARTKAMTRAQVDAMAKPAMAGATAKAAMDAGDAYYGIGAYTEAAAAYRAALGKTGANASLANLRLGMALTRAGDKAGATTAFAAVTGPEAEIAKYWQAWLATRA